MGDNNKCLQVYKSIQFHKSKKKCPKAVAFDLDETLGAFADLHILWVGINKIRKFQIDNPIIQQNEFNSILDIYPEFIRYGILYILDFLYTKKTQGICDKIFIYTNNNCDPPWVSLIMNYFNYKLNIKGTIFDQAVCAFKINNKVLEISRTTKEKTYSDFIKCTLIPKHTSICFIDNTYHEQMTDEKVYYIQPSAYYHDLSSKTIIERFVNSENSKQIANIFQDNSQYTDFFYDWFETNNLLREQKPKNKEIDLLVVQKMMYHIKEFFFQRKVKTRKNKLKYGKITRKHQK